MINAYIPDGVLGERLKDGEKLPDETFALLHATKTVGLNSVSEDNFKTWVHRVRVLRRCHIELDYVNNAPWWPSVSLLRKHLGVQVITNEPEMSDEEFRNFVMEIVEDEIGDMH